LGFAQLGSLVDAVFLLFFALFGAAALHPSMAALFEPVIRVEARLTRPRLALLAGASLVAPLILALQAVRGEPINATLFVVGSATLFLLVVARMAGMMRARERAADREKVLRRAGSTLAASQDKDELHGATLEAALELLKPTPLLRVGLWVGAAEEMKETATTGEATAATFGIGDLPEEVRACFLQERSMRLAPAKIALAPETPWRNPNAREIFVVPLRARGEPTGALVVLGRVPLPQESQNALEVLGAEVALALENLHLLEEVRRTSVLKERQRLSHEIHDTLAQGFTSIVMNLSAAQLAHPEMFSDSAPAQRHLELARRTARESLAETRRLVWALRPEALDRHPLPQALEGLIEEWLGRTGIEASFSVAGVARQLLPETEVALLRIAQEALSNVNKHAGADKVVLTLSYLEDLVALDVSDDGVGFDPNQSAEAADVRPQDTGGFGLVSMRERVQQLDGVLTVESRPNGGTTLAAALPASVATPGRNRQPQERKAVEETR
nr:GAF domain-containing sensor histidine kinase [Actinomycetota bacterium]